jgi:hypothetical protein
MPKRNEKLPYGLLTTARKDGKKKKGMFSNVPNDTSDNPSSLWRKETSQK